MGVPRVYNEPMLKKILLGVIIVVLAAAGAFTLWGLTPQGPAPEALAALQSGGGVAVQSSGQLVFEPENSRPTTGFIFYPGGHVDYRSYAPLARAIAEKGYLVVIVPMPLSLAVLNASAAQTVIDAYPQITHWAVGGHSLGGSMAANFAKRNPGQVQGLLLYASYPASSDDLSASGLAVASIYGTLDGLATGNKIDASRPLLPADTRFVALQGGNHAQFGDYGLQSGDGQAQMTRAEQQRLAVEATIALLEGISK